ncbi:hypothetical protein E3N88_05188 [Mikania micrantha]|uniref:Uncharacterized protein n=1 Tax=Mikania micrantha TaxID=192012 RepID=A0A5N6PZC3_9ASTR|nr:hypothetical protein E3N88_05188 [Mikania micrantha]
MASLPFNPFVVQLYYWGEVSYTQGVVLAALGTRCTSFLVNYQTNYSELVDNICRCVLIDRQSCCLDLTLYYEYNGGSYTSHIQQESDMYLIYQLASLIPGYTCKIHVTWTTVVPNLHQHDGSSSTIAENAKDSPAEEIEETEESEPSLSEYESEDDEPIPPLPQQQSQGLTHFPGLNVVGRGMDEDYIPLDNFGEDEMEFWDEKDPEKAIENIYVVTSSQ